MTTGLIKHSSPPPPPVPNVAPDELRCAPPPEAPPAITSILKFVQPLAVLVDLFHVLEPVEVRMIGEVLQFDDNNNG